MHAGTPTQLAVTVLANFSGKVMAEVEYNNNKVSQTEDFQGGDTNITFLYNDFLSFRRLKNRSTFQV